MIRCRTLGSVDVSLDDGPAPANLLWRKNLALLVYLARSPKRSRARDHLIGLLWPDTADVKARHSLNVALGVLRDCTGDRGISTEADRIRLEAGAVELDTDQFEALAAAGDWEGACGLVRGEFLEGFSVRGAAEFEHWLTAERGLWRTRGVDALVRQADVELGRGRAAEAVALARRALALDRNADVAVRASMRALALAGDRAAALAAYEAFATRLAADVGGTPDAESVALAERISRERAQPRHLEGAASLGAESRRAPLVGREGELEQLGEVWAACRRAARAAVAVVTGDAGTGKSRLADEAMTRARLDGAATAIVRAVEADAADPWSGVFGVARGGLLDAPGVAAASPAALAAFAARLPEWMDRFGGGTASRGVAADPPGRALREVLRAVTAERPVVLVVDDAHWTDRDSLLALVAAVRDLASAPFCLLLTRAAYPARPELDELQARVGRDTEGAVLRLGPLGADALRALVRWAMPQYAEHDAERLARRLARDSAGLPLLAVELLHAVALGLDLDRSAAAWPRPFRTLDQTLPGDLPEGVIGAIRVGFRRLSPAAQQVLAAVASLDERVPSPVLGRATSLGARELESALDELEWERWLAVEPRGYAFVARIVRDIVGGDLVTEGQRQRYREAAASDEGRG
ncbi:MAG TPA: AAA family ATPase [Gemmatimonadales bacterium]